MMKRKRTPKLAYADTLLSVVVLIGLIFGVSVTSQQAATPQSTGNGFVTSTIADSVNGYALQIQSDGVDAYTNNKYIQSIINLGDWVLDTDYSRLSTRSVWLDFTEPVAGSGPNGGNPVAPFSSGLAKVRFISKCHLYNVNMLTIPVGATVNCPLATGFSYGGYDYRLQMNPVVGADVNPETDLVNITCNAANANSQCINWSIAPNGAKGGCATLDCSVMQNVARLSKFVTLKGKTTELNQGDFLVAFSIRVTNP
jgi:hypothetical protein